MFVLIFYFPNHIENNLVIVLDLYYVAIRMYRFKEKRIQHFILTMYKLYLLTKPHFYLSHICVLRSRQFSISGLDPKVNNISIWHDKPTTSVEIYIKLLLIFNHSHSHEYQLVFLEKTRENLLKLEKILRVVTRIITSTT